MPAASNFGSIARLSPASIAERVPTKVVAEFLAGKYKLGGCITLLNAERDEIIKVEGKTAGRQPCGSRINLQQNARDVGTRLIPGLRHPGERHDMTNAVRGTGLLIGVELVLDCGTTEPAGKETRS
jgi:hypothetical protein